MVKEVKTEAELQVLIRKRVHEVTGRDYPVQKMIARDSPGKHRRNWTVLNTGLTEQVRAVINQLGDEYDLAPKS